MGIASHDLTGDGYPRSTSPARATNRLQALIDRAGQPAYGDIGLKRGVNAAPGRSPASDPLPSTAWHPEFDDVNNDGFIDLFVSKGTSTSSPTTPMRDPSNLLIGQADGTFVEGAEAAGIVDFDRGRGAALADLNLDGRLDLVEVNLARPRRLWRNIGVGAGVEAQPIGHWLGVRLRQPGPNRDAIGAWIEVAGRRRDPAARADGRWRAWRRGARLDRTSGSGRRSRPTCGSQWPDGEVGPWMAVRAGRLRHHRARRGRGHAVAPASA